MSFLNTIATSTWYQDTVFPNTEISQVQRSTWNKTQKALTTPWTLKNSKDEEWKNSKAEKQEAFKRAAFSGNLSLVKQAFHDNEIDINQWTPIVLVAGNACISEVAHKILILFLTDKRLDPLYKDQLNQAMHNLRYDRDTEIGARQYAEIITLAQKRLAYAQQQAEAHREAQSLLKRLTSLFR